jgi:hypothetical protein
VLGAELAAAANRRADAAEHRAAVTALLCAAYALDNWFQWRQPGDDGRRLAGDGNPTAPRRHSGYLAVVVTDASARGSRRIPL